MTDWMRIPTRWRAILQPWRLHLQQMSELTRRLYMDDYKWVHVDLGVASTKRNWRENLRRCRETLELLAIIVAAERASETKWPQHHSDHSALHHVLPCRFLLECCKEECIKCVNDVEVFKEFFFAFDENTLRDEFRQALDAIYRQLTPTVKQMVQRLWRFPVEFYMMPNRRGSDLSVAYLKSALELVKAVVERTNLERDGAPRDDSGQWPYRFPVISATARHCGGFQCWSWVQYFRGDDVLFQEEACGLGEDRLPGSVSSVDSGEHDDDDDEPGFALVKAGTSATTKPLEDENQLGADPEALVLRQNGFFRVMRNDKNLE